MDFVENPVYHALRTGNKHLNFGSDNACYLDETVSPFVGIKDGYSAGFDDLFGALPAGRQILHATPARFKIPRGWKLLQRASGIQMIHTGEQAITKPIQTIVSLGEEQIPAMVELAGLTRPGPFNTGTIAFGHYYGIFENGQLAAMAGQRFHPHQFVEISAVCTHPDHLGKGHAATLLQHQVQRIYGLHQQPFLHVRADNLRAIALYKRLGFSNSGKMNFYFMERLLRQRSTSIRRS